MLGQLSEREKAYLYKTAAAFIYPSQYEGFGLTPLEAMSFGLPVACSNSTSLPEVVQDAALLFDSTSSSQTAEAVYAVLHDVDLRARLRQAVLARSKALTWKRTAALTLSCYESVSGPSRAETGAG